MEDTEGTATPDGGADVDVNVNTGDGGGDGEGAPVDNTETGGEDAKDVTK